MVLRDEQVVDFIETYKLATKEQIKKLFFPNTHANVPMRRLKKLAEEECVKRIKLDGNKWIYYAGKKPHMRLLNHDLLITDLVVEMILAGYDIIDFRKSPVICNLIPDAYVKYIDLEGVEKHFVLEVQLSNTIRDCVLKYKDFQYKILDSDLMIETVPDILVVTNMKQREKLESYKIKYLDTNFNGIKDIL